MQDLFSIWFYDYDAQPSMLYRSAMILRQEKWQYVQHKQDAKWWVVYAPTKAIEQEIMALYKQQSVKPIMVILKDEGRSEYHPSWAVLRMPLNYVTFFKWLDELAGQLSNGELSSGELSTELNAEPQNMPSDVDDSKNFEQESWYSEPFRLSRWPNVARFGDDMKVVLFCSKMLRGFCTREQLVALGMDNQQFVSLLSTADAAGTVVYRTHKDFATAPKSAPEKPVAQASTAAANTTIEATTADTTAVETNITDTQTTDTKATEAAATDTPAQETAVANKPQHEQPYAAHANASSTHTPAADDDMMLDAAEIDPKKITLAEIDAIDPLAGETNERSMSLFDAILKVKNLFKIK